MALREMDLHLRRLASSPRSGYSGVLVWIHTSTSTSTSTPYGVLVGIFRLLLRTRYEYPQNQNQEMRKRKETGTENPKYEQDQILSNLPPTMIGSPVSE